MSIKCYFNKRGQSIRGNLIFQILLSTLPKEPLGKITMTLYKGKGSFLENSLYRTGAKSENLGGHMIMQFYETGSTSNRSIPQLFS